MCNSMSPCQVAYLQHFSQRSCLANRLRFMQSSQVSSMIKVYPLSQNMQQTGNVEAFFNFYDLFLTHK